MSQTAKPNAIKDTTEYLLSSKANRKKLLEAIRNVESGSAKNLMVFTAEEWDERYGQHA